MLSYQLRTHVIVRCTSASSHQLTLKVLSDIGPWLVFDLYVEIFDFIWKVVGLFGRGVYDIFDSQIFEWNQMGGVLGVSKVKEVFDDLCVE